MFSCALPDRAPSRAARFVGADSVSVRHGDRRVDGRVHGLGPFRIARRRGRDAHGLVFVDLAIVFAGRHGVVVILQGDRLFSILCRGPRFFWFPRFYLSRLA